jgi:hypothetical protein
LLHQKYFKQRIHGSIRAAVRRYPRWDEVYRTLYGKAPPRAPSPKRYLEKDGKPPETARRPGVGESPEHRRLKEWAAEHPRALNLPGSMTGQVEQPLLRATGSMSCSAMAIASSRAK